jgi:hypothetical protein
MRHTTTPYMCKARKLAAVAARAACISGCMASSKMKLAGSDRVPLGLTFLQRCFCLGMTGAVWTGVPAHQPGGHGQ